MLGILTLTLLSLQGGPTIRVIPRPAGVELRPGTFSLPGEALRGLGELEAPRGVRLNRVPSDSALGAEGYRLEVSPGGVTITAAADAGLFYGTQTVRQLLERQGGGWRLPAVSITDRPRFRYRGLMLDVARHFMPVPAIKQVLDLMARYKLNTFHWHLTDDQGWRLEIRKYPLLTQVGAWRPETILEKHFDPYLGDGAPHAGFYSQDDVRDVVAYAAARHITVVPEIEMPGHAMAALAAYPELACTPGPFRVATAWGVTDDILCPSERTFAFLEDVLREVMELFPGRYIHVGGDEAPKVRWKASPVAQALIGREGLKDEQELQGWFMRRIGAFLRANGRILVGWDEILQGGLGPDAVVMSWRGIEGGIAAARQGHDVVMTPTSHLYLDYYQGDPATEPLAIGGNLPLETVYGFEPIPDVLTSAEAAHIVGVQANLWTEYLKTPDAVEYMLLPRLLALAEVAWSPRAARDWPDFSTRLSAQFADLDRLALPYRIPDVPGLEADRLVLDDVIELTLGMPVAGGTVRYTLDGSVPDANAPSYAGPLRIPLDTMGTVVTARVILPDGRMGPARSIRVTRAVLQGAEKPRGRLEPGLRYDYYETSVRSVDSLVGATPVREGLARAVALTGSERPERFGLVFHGWLRAPTAGIYTFHLTSDDGSDLSIGGRRVVNHDGAHAAEEKSGQVALSAGLHRLTVRYFQAGGGKALGLRVTLPGSAAPVPVDSYLMRKKR